MKKIFVSALVALCGFTASYAQQASFLSNNHLSLSHQPGESEPEVSLASCTGGC